MLHAADERVKEQLLSDMTMKTEVEETAQSSAHVDIEIHANPIKEEPGLVQFVKSEPAMSVKEEFLEDSRHDDNEQQCTPIPTGTRSVTEACSTRLGDLINIKHEPSDIDVEPTVLQHMDIHYTINKVRLQSLTSTTSTRAIVGRTSAAADNVERGQLLDIKEPLGYTDLDIGPTVLQHMDSHYTSNQIELNAIKQENTIPNLDSEGVLSRIKDSLVINESTEDSQKGSSKQQEVEMKESDICRTLQPLELKMIHKEHLESIWSVHLKRLDTFQCDLCDLVYLERRWLVQHLQSVHRSRPKTGAAGQNWERLCVELDPAVFFPNEPVAWPKCRSNYKSTKTFRCQYCGKGYNMLRALNVHSESRHGMVAGGRALPCEVCPALLLSPRALAAHRASHVHHGRLPCLYCMPPLAQPGDTWCGIDESPDKEPEPVRIRFTYRKNPTWWFYSVKGLMRHRATEHPEAGTLGVDWHSQWGDR